MAARGLSPKSRRNALGAFRSFLGWLYKRSEIRELPREIPWPKVSEHAPKILAPETQRLVLEQIPAKKRGIFLCMAISWILTLSHHASSPPGFA